MDRAELISDLRTMEGKKETAAMDATAAQVRNGACRRRTSTVKCVDSKY
jgi:hypothetical protein